MAERGHPEADAILGHLAALGDQLGPRSWWTRYAFHFTELANVPSILRLNALYSRAGAEGQGIITAQVGDRRILDRTDDQVLDSVRFYWRPRTPMLHEIEGIRLPDRYAYPARCEVPVFVCVPMRDLLTRADTRFTDRTAASPWSQVGSDYQFVRGIPFDLVYHDTWFTRDQRDEIISRRQAEVLVPGRFALTDGTRLLFRSEAELDTLRDMLSPALTDTWGRRMAVSTPYPAFFRKWLHVDRVTRHEDALRIQFNEQARPDQVGEPVPVVVKFENLETGRSESRPFDWGGMKSLQFSGLGVSTWRVTITLRSVLAYSAVLSP